VLEDWGRGLSGVPRSQKLLAVYSSTGSAQAQWGDPDNYVTLVKTLHAHNGNAAAATVNMYLSMPNWGAWVPAVEVTIQPATYFDWEGWIVLNPGDALLLSVSAASVMAWLSGSVLAGPPQFPNAPLQLPRVEPHR
jgi:hypothetical protein